MNAARAIAFANLVPLVACGTSGTAAPNAPASTSITGIAWGQPIVSQDTVGLYNAGSVSTSPYAGAFVSSFAGSCDVYQSGMTAPPSSQLLAIEVMGPGSTVPGPGTYVYGATNGGELLVQYAASDATCVETTSESATGGSITLDTVTAAAIAGSFDVTFPGGDHLSGSFAGAVCNFDMSTLGQHGTACIQRDP